MRAVIAGGTPDGAAELGELTGVEATWLGTAGLAGGGSLDASVFESGGPIGLLVVRTDDRTDAPDDLAKALSALRDGVLSGILPLQAGVPHLDTWCRVVWVVAADAVDGVGDPVTAAIGHAAMGAMRAVTREFATGVSTTAIIVDENTPAAALAHALRTLADETSRFYSGQILRLCDGRALPAAVPAREPAADTGAQVAVVTGAAAGMGRAHARTLCDAGWYVYAVDRDADGLAALAADAGDGRIAYWAGDLRDEDAWPSIAEGARRRFGRVDGLVNNAGYGLQRPLTELSADDILDQQQIHVAPALALSRQLADDLQRADGAIVNVSSTYALAGPCTYPQPPAIAYCMAKSAAIGLTRSLARELAPRVRVNALAPGGTRSDTTLGKYSAELLQRKIDGVPAARWAEPHEYSVIVGYLLDAGAVPVTGQVLSPNGGEVIAQC